MMRFENLRVAYDEREALAGVSGTWHAGQLTALTGPNGSGKSTLLKCAAGLMKPADGSVFLRETEIGALPRRMLARAVAYMPQSRSVPEITVRRLAEHGRYPHLRWGCAPGAEDRRIVEDALACTGMAELAERPVRQLSGGERQRAYIAMMLAQQADVLLLDEPTAWLDLSARFGLMKLLKELSREGRTVVVVLHELALAMEYADCIWVLDRGRHAFSGRPEELFESGKIQRVFGIEAERTQSGGYLFFGEMSR